MTSPGTYKYRRLVTNENAEAQRARVLAQGHTQVEEVCRAGSGIVVVSPRLPLLSGPSRAGGTEPQGCKAAGFLSHGPLCSSQNVLPQRITHPPHPPGCAGSGQTPGTF